MPLGLIVAAGITAVVMTGILAWQSINRSAQVSRSTLLRFADAGARAVRPALVHDDPWQIYELLTALLPPEESPVTPRIGVVLDAAGNIVVSTQPMRYPAFSAPPADSWINAAFAQDRGANAQFARAIDVDGSDLIVAIAPVVTDDQLIIGWVGVEGRKLHFADEFAELFRTAALPAACVAVILLPLGWWLGRRISRPLATIAAAVDKVGTDSPNKIIAALPPSGPDEIGVLSHRMKSMLQGLEEKAALEREFIAAERLAAIGRLTSGIAHEINNPLGGMLNAISTFKRHGDHTALGNQTISLIERGLLQIKETVSALLVDSKPSARKFSEQDVRDTRVLLESELMQYPVELAIECELVDPVNLPANPLRQILMNLLLNAIHAASPNGHVHCAICQSGGSLLLSVTNDGKKLPDDFRDHLFEPFRKDGGLGLWITYQLVQQMDGHISVLPSTDKTAFDITLPIREIS